ncbi:maleylpyruvate isomerase family mycothiol-dependent enzyme [Cellulomonas sp. Marseille-Q8402]
MPAPQTRAGDLLPALAGAQDDFARLLTSADLDAPVPTCGAWTVTDLALHLGGVHRWAAGMARGTDDGGDDPAGPRDPAALRAFYREQADALVTTLRDLGPAAPGLTLNGPGPAAFWHRRQLHETLVHLHDLALATGTAHPVDDPALWADAVDEVVTVMTPRQVRLGRLAPLAVPVRLVAADAGRAWALGPAEEPRATVTGPTRTLALLLWGRAAPADPTLATTGDPAALTAALAGPLTP